MKKILSIAFLLSTVLICNYSYASECEAYDEAFNNNYHVSYISNSQVLVTAKDKSNNINIQVSLGDTFQGIRDHHSSINYKLSAVFNKSAKFMFSSKFDARSFGGEVTECKGEIIAKYKNA